MSTTQQEESKKGNNPNGVGGFGDNPQNRNPGGWRKEVSFSYQYKRFMAMTSKELAEWAKTPADERTVVEDLAYARVVAAKKSLADVKEMTDRTEGKAPQSIDLTSKGEKIVPATVVDLGNLNANIDQAEQSSDSD